MRISDESIGRIGYECGFISPAHLSGVFKSKYGVAPSRYRQGLTDK
ncbi:MAG: AraC family transcriptional regulator [Flavobacteriales bacterium]|nr:AraC family transcriptional regulator [Flavobacteriales bacterium]